MTDRRRLFDGPELSRSLSCLLLQVKHAIEAGVDVVQIRERDLEGATLAQLVSEAVALANGTVTRIVVNDRLDIALATRAAGVHLPADSIPAAAARAIAPRGFLVGRSVHDVREAARVNQDVDYLIAGTVWPTFSKAPDAPLLGLSGLASIVKAVSVPVLAIGGVTMERVDEVRACGAAGVAAIGMFMGAREHGCGAAALSETVSAVRMRFDTPRGAS